MNATAFKITPETKKKLEELRKRMTLICGYKTTITWDEFFSAIAVRNNEDINNFLERRFEILLEENNVLRAKINEINKQQKTAPAQTVPAFVQENDFVKIIQKLETIEAQNTNLNLSIKSLQEFNFNMNENLKSLIDSVRILLSNIGDMTLNLSEKITQKVKHLFGLSVPMILFHITKNNSISVEKKSDEEATKDINAAVSRYQKFYNSSDGYSGQDINEIIDKYSMKDKLKSG